MLCKLLFLYVTLPFAAPATDKVICYYESWAEGFEPEDIDVNICTHVNYVYLGVTVDGGLRLDEGDDKLTRFSQLKSTNPDVKLLINVESNTGFSHIANSSEAINNLTQNILYYINTYNLDGVDIDWEYPNDKDNFLDILQTIKIALDDDGGSLLTVAVSADPEGGAYDIPAISQLADAINIMTYDFHQDAGQTGENSPLYSSNLDDESCDSAINNWLNRGADPQKLILGLGFYGHTFKLSDPDVHGIGAPADGAGINNGTMGYNEICSLDWTEEWDDEQEVPYKYHGNDWIGYDNPRSIGLKVQYAKSRNLGGVMVWAVDNDDKDGACGQKNALLEAIQQNL